MTCRTSIHSARRDLRDLEAERADELQDCLVLCLRSRAESWADRRKHTVESEEGLPALSGLRSDDTSRGLSRGKGKVLRGVRS